MGDVQLYMLHSKTNIYLSQPLRSLGGFTDTLDYENKRVIRYIWEEKPTYSSTNYFAQSFAIELSKKASTSSTTGRYIRCNYMEGTNSTPTSAERAGKVFLGSSQTYAGFGETSTFPIAGDENPSTIEKRKFQDWLQNNNVLIYYVLQEAIHETIDIPLIETIDGTSIIEVDTKLEPSSVNFKYWKQI